VLLLLWRGAWRTLFPYTTLFRSFAAAAVLVLVMFIVTFWLNSPVLDALFNLAFLGLWVAVAIAVLKYRLYDIDVVISKAVLYGRSEEHTSELQSPVDSGFRFLVY